MFECKEQINIRFSIQRKFSFKVWLTNFLIQYISHMGAWNWFEFAWQFLSCLLSPPSQVYRLAQFCFYLWWKNCQILVKQTSFENSTKSGFVEKLFETYLFQRFKNNITSFQAFANQIHHHASAFFQPTIFVFYFGHVCSWVDLMKKKQSGPLFHWSPVESSAN